MRDMFNSALNSFLILCCAGSGDLSRDQGTVSGTPQAEDPSVPRSHATSPLLLLSAASGALLGGATLSELLEQTETLFQMVLIGLASHLSVISSK